MSSISFNLIPNLLLTPGAYIEYDSSRAVQGLAALPNRVLLIGNRTSGGSVAEAVLVQITRASDGQAMFGANSQLSRMVEKFKGASKFTEVWAVALDDAGTAATKTLTVSGTATSTGTLYVWIHGERIPVEIASGDDQDAAATKIGDAITAHAATKNLLFTETVVDEVVTLTATQQGAFTQDLDVRMNYEISAIERDALPAGISVVVADGVSGASNPDVTTALAVTGGLWFTKIVLGYSDSTNVAATEAYLEDKFGPLEQEDGMLYVGKNGAYSALTTYGGGRNSKLSSVMHVGGVAGNSPTPEFEMAAVVAAVDSNEPDPARPRQTLHLPGVLPPARDDLFDQSERNLLLQNGISTFTVDQSGKVYIERLITTYQTNAAGVADTTFLNVNTLHTLMALRYTLRVRITTKYPRHKLADDGTNYGPGQAIVTPQIIKAEVLGIFGEWELNGWVEDFEQFSEELVVARNTSDADRVDVLLGPNLINQFRVFAGQIQFIVN